MIAVFGFFWVEHCFAQEPGKMKEATTSGDFDPPNDNAIPTCLGLALVLLYRQDESRLQWWLVT